MPRTTIVDLPPAEQAHILAELCRARYGYLLALHILLLCAAQRSPTEIAAVLFCSRSTVYRVVKAYRAGQLGGLAEGEEAGQERPQRRLTVLSPALQRSVLAILHSVPRLCGWCRTRWSCATLALELHTRRGVAVSAETVRRWLHELDWVWKRAKLIAKDEDPQRVEKLARIRVAFEQVEAGGALFFADELDISLLPKVGYQWMPKGAQVEVMTPGTNEKRYLAGALDIATGTITQCVWYRKTTGLFLDPLDTLDRAYPRLGRSPTSPLWLTTPRFTMPRRSRSGWPPIPASSYSTCPPTAPMPIRLSGPLAMATISAPATIRASAWGIWCRMSSGTCRLMVRGPMSSPTSTTPRR